jgi:hypothetical protein
VNYQVSSATRPVVLAFDRQMRVCLSILLILYSSGASRRSFGSAGPVDLRTLECPARQRLDPFEVNRHMQRKSRRSRPTRNARPPEKRGSSHKEPGKPRAARRSALAQAVTPKKALAEAIQHLGADATPADLVQFAKERFGLVLQFAIVIPRSALATAGPDVQAGRNQGRRKAG